MRTRMVASLGTRQHEPREDPLARPVTDADIQAIARLMLDAYRGTADDGGESFDDAVAEVTKLLAGAYGEFDRHASEVIVRDAELVSATFVTRYENEPLIAFSMTSPQWKRRGLARAGLVRVMDRLRAAGEPRVRLVVTNGNTPAEALYASLGFVADGP
ncbi:MAG: GNAT family N-acetyltransferase [Phycisphaerales bacterium]